MLVLWWQNPGETRVWLVNMMWLDLTLPSTSAIVMQHWRPRRVIPSTTWWLANDFCGIFEHYQSIYREENWFQALEGVVVGFFADSSMHFFCSGSSQPIGKPSYQRQGPQLLLWYLHSVTNMMRYDFVQTRLTILQNVGQALHVRVYNELVYACIMLHASQVTGEQSATNRCHYS